jgi:(p)ppGpp synthase/HD superfamily hydrolase
MLVAAVLHDVVEDTPVELTEIKEEFGPVVATYVDGLTDVSRPEDGNRAERKALDRDHTAEQSAEVQTIKLADLIHNTASIEQHDPSFYKVYKREKIELLKVLTKGDLTLMFRAQQQIGGN